MPSDATMSPDVMIAFGQLGPSDGGYLFELWLHLLPLLGLLIVVHGCLFSVFLPFPDTSQVLQVLWQHS